MNEVKLLNKAYTKRFKRLNKNILASEESGLLVFVEHLKYLRDAYILTMQPTGPTTTLIAAIEEFKGRFK